MANKHMKRWSTSFISHQGFKIKTTISCSFTKTSIVYNKQKKITRAGEDVEKLKLSHSVGKKAK